VSKDTAEVPWHHVQPAFCCKAKEIKTDGPKNHPRKTTNGVRNIMASQRSVFSAALYMITGADRTQTFIDVEGFIFAGGHYHVSRLCCILTDLLTEVYGFNRARRAVWTVLMLQHPFR
jgi:hypothetical protein